MKIITPSQGALPFGDIEVQEIRSVLQGGGVIVYPTDTLYGLGVDVSSLEAVDKLYNLKSRGNSPVSVLTESVDHLLGLVKDIDEKGAEMIKAFMPGALTVICKSEQSFDPPISSQNGSVGFRVPGDPISTLLPGILGKPISTTSVNPAGLAPATSLEEVKAYYGEQIDLMIDVGPIQPSKGSTVIDLTNHPYKILREGEISRQSLQDFLN